MSTSAVRRKAFYFAAAVFAAVVVCAAIFAFPAEASSGPGNAVGFINYKNEIALRAAPQDSSKTILALKNDTKVTILEEVFSSKTSRKTKYHWYKVKVSGKTGYVHVNRIDGIRYSKSAGKITRTTTSRLGAGAAMTKGLKLKKGKSYSVYLKVKSKSGNTWYKIKSGGKYYYVSGSSIRVSAPEKTDGGTSGGSSDNGSTPKIVTDADAANAETTGVTTSSVKVRSSTVSSSSVVSSVSAGTKIAIIEEIYTSDTTPSASKLWYHVTVSGKDGYIPSSAVRNVSYTLTSGASTDYINFRSGPSASMPYKGSMEKDCAVNIAIDARVAGSKAVWKKVQLGRSYYYVHSAYISAGKKATSGATYHVLPSATSAQQARAKVLTDALDTIGAGIIKNKFTYSNSGVKSTYDSALKSAKKVNCALYVSWAAQQAGLIDKGKTFWLNKSINGNAASQLRSSKKVTVLYPDIQTTLFPFEPGDICGYDWGTSHHTMVYAGKNSKGQALWYTAGAGDIKAKNLGPVVKKSYDSRLVNVVIRVN